MTDFERKELKRIARKARRFAARNKCFKPAVFNPVSASKLLYVHPNLATNF